MAHFTTDKVIVFPSAYRGQNASSASKYTSEQNITNLIKSMISNDDGSFVVGYTSSGVLKVIISGYIEKIGLEDSFWTTKINGEKIKGAKLIGKGEVSKVT